MKILNNKIIFPILCILVLSIGIWGGIKWRDYRNSKTAVFRISTQKKSITYDLLAAINYLQYRLEKQGYTVLPWRYPGAFYHQKGDNAGINIFIRSNEFFFDTRMNKNALDIYYLHRFSLLYKEEMQNYDYYLSSQKNLQEALPNYANVVYFESGAIPHQRLKPQYKYDILYISEDINPQYLGFISKNYNIRYFTSLSFGNFPEQKKEELLKEARLVVYDIEQSPLDDADYTPYAVYDILSYGRPLITNRNPKLSQLLGNDIDTYQTLTEMIDLTNQVLTKTDDAREQKAEIARQKVLDFSEKQTISFSSSKK